jgi:hypothetical protein
MSDGLSFLVTTSTSTAAAATTKKQVDYFCREQKHFFIHLFWAKCRFGFFLTPGFLRIEQ